MAIAYIDSYRNRFLLQSICSILLNTADESFVKYEKNVLIFSDTIGYLSLRILCLDDAKSSVPLLVEKHPEVLLPFAKENSADLDTWRLMLKCLQDELNSKSEREEWYAAMQETLDYLAKTLVLDTFLEILPGSSKQSNDDFQSYIQLCRKNQQAHQIQTLIVNTGHKLLSTLTF